MELKREFQFQEKVKSGWSNIVLLIPAYCYFPIRFHIPDQIVIRNWNLLHLAFFKSDNLEKCKVFGTNSLDIDTKSLQDLTLNITESLIRLNIVLDRVAHCKIKVEGKEFFANETIQLEF